MMMNRVIFFLMVSFLISNTYGDPFDFFISPYGWSNEDDIQLFVNEIDQYIRKKVIFSETDILLPISKKIKITNNYILAQNEEFYFKIIPNISTSKLTEFTESLKINTTDTNNIFFICEKGGVNSSIWMDEETLNFENYNFEEIYSPTGGYLVSSTGLGSLVLSFLETERYLIDLHSLQQGSFVEKEVKLGQYLGLEKSSVFYLSFTEREECKILENYLVIIIVRKQFK